MRKVKDLDTKESRIDDLLNDGASIGSIIEVAEKVLKESSLLILEAERLCNLLHRVLEHEVSNLESMTKRSSVTEDPDIANRFDPDLMF